MTRYPKGGKGRKWTALELKNIPVEWAGDQLGEERLQGAVKVAKDGAVSVAWRTPYKWEGKLNWFYCGTTPHDSMEDIRVRRDSARAQVKAGVNPTLKKKADKIEAQAWVAEVIKQHELEKASTMTLGDLINEWLANGVKRQDGNAQLRSQFDSHVLGRIPGVETIPFQEITQHHLALGLKALVADGKLRQCEVVAQNLRSMYKWAEQRKPWRRHLIDGNPAYLINLKTILPVDREHNPERTRVLSADEIKELKQTFIKSEAEYAAAPNKFLVPKPLARKTQLALWTCLSTMCRIGELTMARWEHIDFENRHWFIPAANTKKVRGRRTDHNVYLSDFSLQVFKELHEITGSEDWLFPSNKDTKDSHIAVNEITKQVGNRQAQFKSRTATQRIVQDNSLVLAGGTKGDWTPHDLRRTGATLMRSLKIDPDVIDLCQHHTLPGGKVRRTYQQYGFTEEMRDAWGALGAHLEGILGKTP